MARDCQFVHQHIISGECPWCRLVIGVPQSLANQSLATAELLWDPKSLLQAVECGTDEQATYAVRNVVLHSAHDELLLPVIQAAVRRNGKIADVALVYLDRHATQLTPEQLREYESRLVVGVADAEAFVIRAMLLLAYFGRDDEANGSRRRAAHILWIVVNYPDKIPAHALQFYIVSEEQDGEIFLEVQRAWIKNVENNPGNLRILENAAQFFSLHDLLYAESLYSRARMIEPNNPKWSSQIAMCHQVRGLKLPPSERAQEAKCAVNEYQRALADKDSDSDRWSDLSGLTKAALDAADLKTAQSGSAELLSLVTTGEYSRSMDLRHASHVLAGRCAMAAGDVSAAIDELKRAARYPCSPGFGPSLRLAQQLLEHNAYESVIEYLKECSKSWELGRNRIEEWIQEIQDGKVPDFGPNLEY
jgi:hypothetical protein